MKETDKKYTEKDMASALKVEEETLREWIGKMPEIIIPEYCDTDSLFEESKLYSKRDLQILAEFKDLFNRNILTADQVADIVSKSVHFREQCKDDTISENVLYYNVGNMAKILGVETSTIRYWNKMFDKWIKGKRNNHNNRMYDKKDVETFRIILYLLKEKGMTINGVKAVLSSPGYEKNRKREQALQILNGIKLQLESIKKYFE